MIREHSSFSTLENWHEWDAQLTNPLIRATDAHHANAYYRSKLLTVNYSINSIIKAAAPLLLISNRLKTAIDNFDPLLLYHELCHEMKAFENKIQAEGYPEPMIIAARYIMCIFIDEIILATTWGRNSLWQQQNLLTTFQNVGIDRDKFFVILERCCEMPEKHLDLLELIYLCLAFGYEGKFRSKEQGIQRLNTIYDNLYKIIRQNRQEFSLTQFEETSSALQISNKWLISLLFFSYIALLIAIYSVFDYSLDKRATHLQQELQQLESNYFQ